jgi:hypothetical protein
MSNVKVTTPEGLFGRGDDRRYSPLYGIVRHICDFLKWRFSKLPTGAYRFDPESDDSPEQKNSEIWIGAEAAIKPEMVGARPAIAVIRSQAGAQGTGLADHAFTELHTGAKSRMDIYPTNIMINCLSKMPEEAEMIAWFVQEQIGAFREEICKEMVELLYLGSRPMISPPSPAGTLVDGSDVDWSVVVVGYPVYLQAVVHKYPLNRPIVNQITTTVTTTPPAVPVDPVVPLQGTAVMQPDPASSSPNLPQEGPGEASSTEPLTVEIQTR